MILLGLVLAIIVYLWVASFAAALTFFLSWILLGFVLQLMGDAP